MTTAADLALHVAALLVYPGAILSLAFGLPLERAAALALRGRSALEAVRGPRDAWARPAVLASWALAALAATQLAIPFNAVSPVERNLLVAAVALACATWLVPGRGRQTAARAAVLSQACWLAAVLAPALVSQSLRPQALGAVVVPAELPLKAGSALLYLLCLPGLLGLEAPATPARAALWLPFCGLGVSLYLPPRGDDAAGALAFLAASGGAAAVAIGLARAGAPGGRAARLLGRGLPPLVAGAVLALAAATAALT